MDNRISSVSYKNKIKLDSYKTKIKVTVESGENEYSDIGERQHAHAEVEFRNPKVRNSIWFSIDPLTDTTEEMQSSLDKLSEFISSLEEVHSLLEEAYMYNMNARLKKEAEEHRLLDEEKYRDLHKDDIYQDIEGQYYLFVREVFGEDNISKTATIFESRFGTTYTGKILKEGTTLVYRDNVIV